MNWKIFIAACVSLAVISFPQNMIGCGPQADPYDYYTSFFNPDISQSSNLKPFYYTGYEFLYDIEEPVSTPDVLASEWAAYCGKPVTDNDAKNFLTLFSVKDITALYFNIEKQQATKLSDSVRKNSMTAYFISSKDLEALGYLLYAKKLEPHVSTYDSWEPVNRDSSAMARLIKNGLQLHTAAKTENIRLRYAYQVTRLAHYSRNYPLAIQLYDKYVSTNKTASVLQPLSLALKAGAMFHIGSDKEAVYLFSKAFAESDVKKISNFLGFTRAYKSAEKQADYLALCKTPRERANMLALFALWGSADQTLAVHEIFALDPQNNMLQTLIAREINKLEEKYFSADFNKMPGGYLSEFNWLPNIEDTTSLKAKTHLQKLSIDLKEMSKSVQADRAFYLTAAAYCAVMLKDFKTANDLVMQANVASPVCKTKDQLQLTALLVAINEQPQITAASEEKLLPALKWLQIKALAEPKKNYAPGNTWKIFYRNIMAGAIAKKYHAQGDIYKEVLAVGNSGKVTDFYGSIEMLHNRMDIKDVEKLYTFLNAKQESAFDNFLTTNNTITRADVAEFAGTAYLRNYDFTSAIKWFTRSPVDANAIISKNPFFDQLYDLVEATQSEKTTKLQFAKEMQKHQQLAVSDKANAAKHIYRLAVGMYNMTYYGHAWELVQYDRSGVDGYAVPKDATEFQKQYYGCYAAHDMFKKAMDASADREFKARCLFMMAKCAQKDVRRPGYNDFSYSAYSQYEAAEQAYLPLFMNNGYFPRLIKEYGNTKFFIEAESRCSYLRDFTKRK